MTASEAVCPSCASTKTDILLTMEGASVVATWALLFTCAFVSQLYRGLTLKLVRPWGLHPLARLGKTLTYVESRLPNPYRWLRQASRTSYRTEIESKDDETLTDPVTYDTIIIGAGISGINAGYRIATQVPGHRFAIFEGRDDLGGTWDVFRYPGVRTDSDMVTYGFAWHPWPHDAMFADGAAIMAYLRDAVAAAGLGRHIRLRHRVVSADWSTAARRWTVVVEHGDDGGRRCRSTVTAAFVVLGTGPFDHAAPRPAEIPGLADFAGPVLHPQAWPADYDPAGRTIVVVGSGATAVTLVPALAAAGAARVTMLQRSPSYVAAVPRALPRPWLLRLAAPLLSPGAARALLRAYLTLAMHARTTLCRRFPAAARARLARLTAAELAATGIDAGVHFRPAYDPWAQRLCLSPEGDFFAALRGGRAAVATAAIESVVAGGVRLAGGGGFLPADTLVTATGSRLALGGRVALAVDGRPVRLGAARLWNRAMLAGVPNLFLLVGFPAASWTLGVDGTARTICRLLLRTQRRRGGGGASSQQQQQRRRVVVVAVPDEKDDGEETPMWPLESTYVREARARLPKCGVRGLWRPQTDVVADAVRSRWGDVTQGLRFLE